VGRNLERIWDLRRAAGNRFGGEKVMGDCGRGRAFWGGVDPSTKTANVRDTSRGVSNLHRPFEFRRKEFDPRPGWNTEGKGVEAVWTFAKGLLFWKGERILVGGTYQGIIRASSREKNPRRRKEKDEIIEVLMAGHHNKP